MAPRRERDRSAFLLVADRMQDAVEAKTGRRGAQTAALTALHAWADGHPIDDLAGGLGLSHSRTVRVSTPSSGTSSRFAAPIRGSTSGGGRADRPRNGGRDGDPAARPPRPFSTISSDPYPRPREHLARASESILLHAIHDRAAARLACRLCDVEACGHHDGRCPSTQAAMREIQL